MFVKFLRFEKLIEVSFILLLKENFIIILLFLLRILGLVCVDGVGKCGVKYCLEREKIWIIVNESRGFEMENIVR